MEASCRGEQATVRKSRPVDAHLRRKKGREGEKEGGSLSLSLPLSHTPWYIRTYVYIYVYIHSVTFLHNKSHPLPSMGDSVFQYFLTGNMNSNILHAITTFVIKFFMLTLHVSRCEYLTNVETFGRLFQLGAIIGKQSIFNNHLRKGLGLS